MRFLLLFLFLVVPLKAAMWIYYPAAYCTFGDKSDGVNLVEGTTLVSAARNDRQFYTMAYTIDKLSADDWKYTQHTAVVAATWPMDKWALSVAAVAVNGRLKDVPAEFSPLNKGLMGAFKLTRLEGNLKWGLLADSYDEPSGLEIQHGGVLVEYNATKDVILRSLCQATFRNSDQDRFASTIEVLVRPLRPVRLQADYAIGKTALPFSWTTLILNNTPAEITQMWGAKCEWNTGRVAKLTAGYRFTNYDNSDANYVYAGMQLRLVAR